MSPGALEGSWLESLSIENRGVEKVMRNEPQLLPLKLSVILRELSQAVKTGLSKVPKHRWRPITTVSVGAVLTVTDASSNNHSVSRTAMIALLPRRHRALILIRWT